MGNESPYDVEIVSQKKSEGHWIRIIVLGLMLVSFKPSKFSPDRLLFGSTI